MINKQKIRISDRKKLERRIEGVKKAFGILFDAEIFCNRCYKNWPFEYEIAHGNYDAYRFAELVCRECHENIDFNNKLLPLLQLIKEKQFPKKFAVLTFQTNSSTICISKNENGKQSHILITRLSPFGNSGVPFIPPVKTIAT